MSNIKQKLSHIVEKCYETLTAQKMKFSIKDFSNPQIDHVY